MKLEFWSTSLAAPKQPLLNLLVELVGNYPPMPLVTQKITFQSILLEPPPTPPFLSPAVRRCPTPPLSPPLAQDGGAAAAGGCPGERRELGAASAPSGRSGAKPPKLHRPHRRGPPDDDWVDVTEVLVTPAAGGGLTNGAFLGVRSAPAGSHSIFPVGKLWSACDVRILQICSSVLSAMLFLFVFPFPDKVISSICT